LRDDDDEDDEAAVLPLGIFINPDFRAPTTGVVCCRERLGGLIKSYYRAAA
jgi:hypothetical protein